MKSILLCSNCLSILNVYGGCDKCNKLLLKEIEEKVKAMEEESGRSKK